MGHAVVRATQNQSKTALIGNFLRGTRELLTAKVAPPFDGRESLTVLLLGTDQTNNLCDTIILSFVDLKSKRMALMSVPRDSWVQAATGGRTKITHVFPLAMEKSDRIEDGIAAVKQTVERNLGIPIDRFARVDIQGFSGIVDSVGGVELNVEKRMKYTDRSQKLFIDLLPGRQELDGDKALQYVRFRSDAEGDLGRVERQQRFLSALAAKLSQTADEKDVWALGRAASRMLRYTTTDMTVDEAYDLGALIHSVDLAGIETRTAAGVADMVGEMSVYVLNLPQIQQDVNELQTVVAQRPNVAPERMALVEVLNGSEVPQLAARTADYLETCGFRVAKVGNADARTYSDSAVLFGPGNEQTAGKVALALHVPSESIAEAAALGGADANVQVILGKTFDVPREGQAASSPARP